MYKELDLEHKRMKPTLQCRAIKAWIKGFRYYTEISIPPIWKIETVSDVNIKNLPYRVGLITC